MSSKDLVPFLRVVQPDPHQPVVAQKDFRTAPWQQTLFAVPLPNLLMFVNFDAINETDFLAAILNGRPKYILDLRPAPRFDLGTLNRRLVFSVFEQVGAQYYDIAGKLGIRSPRDAKLNPALLVPALRSTVFRTSARVEGPIIILFSTEQWSEEYETLLTKQLDSLSELGWEVLRIPHSLQPHIEPQKRELIFISHANPEDNDFVLWLSAHLSTLGYLVWSDVTNLVGGEKFWDTIEDAIRTHAVRVIVCLSRSAQIKEGFLDEIACSIGTERSRGFNNFVVPIRLDDLPYTDVRANVGRKNIIDFSGGWTSGLSALIKAFEHDGVPRPIENGPEAVSLMARLRTKSTSTLTAETEILFANWLLCNQLPESVTFLEFSGSTYDVSAVRAAIARPTFAYLRLVGGFVQPNEAQESVPPNLRIAHRCTISISDFLSGHSSELPGLGAKEARNYLTSLFRQAWDSRATALGLLPYSTAGKTIAWYVPKGLISQDTVQFLAPDGTRRRKLLVGRSEKRNVFWHFAIESIPSLSHPRRFCLRPHVIFTQDGRIPLQSDARMHVLRRGFCRNWWNDRWRDLIAAYANWFADGGDTIELQVSQNTVVRVSSRLVELTSPTKLVQCERQKGGGDNDIPEPDWADDPDIDEVEQAGVTLSPESVDGENV